MILHQAKTWYCLAIFILTALSITAPLATNASSGIHTQKKKPPIEKLRTLYWRYHQATSKKEKTVQEKKILACYNELCKEKGKAPVKKIADIDTLWIELEYLQFFTNDTVDQTLSKKSKKSLAFIKEFVKDTPVQVFYNRKKSLGNFSITGITSYQPIIVLSNDNNPEEAAFIFLHELGHIYHEDIYIDPYDLSLQEIRIIQREAEFAHDITTITTYIEMGKTAFTQKTRVGRHINKTLAKKHVKQHGFWKKPKNKNAAARLLYARQREQRADLFALTHLLEGSNIETIVAVMFDFFKDTEIVVCDKDEHPSGFERALCFAGALKEHGHDVNALCKKYEKIYNETT